MVGVLHRDVGRCCKDPEPSWDLWISCFYPKGCRQKYYKVTATHCSTMKLSQNNQSIADDKQCSGWRALRLKLLLGEGIGNELQGFKEQLSEGILKVSILAAENVKNLRRLSEPCLGWHGWGQVSTFSNVAWEVWWKGTGAVHQPVFLALLCALCAAGVEFSQRAAESVDSFGSKVTTGAAGMPGILPQTINEK